MPTPTGLFYAPTTQMPYSYPCPAGKTCTASAAVDCMSPKSSIFGSNVCSNAVAGKFTPNVYMGHWSCPTGTYQTLTTGATTCNLCDAGKSCSSTTAAAADCATGTFSALGVTKCDSPNTGYLSSATAGAAMKPCLEGQYYDSATKTCKTCPVGSTCSETAVMT
jgi:hypothetical protein